jgi:hypothetical protein
MEVIGIALYMDVCVCVWRGVPDKWFYPKNADCFFVDVGIT